MIESLPDFTPTPWWRSAVVYQVYPRSFADDNGDGIGDLPGIRARLPYLADLGVDAIWISPWYPSPMKDSGYDVSDFRSIEPSFGTLDDAEALLADAHTLGLKVIIDIVPNHFSDQHEWFTQALAAAPGSPQRARFAFREGRGTDGAQPPNDWQSEFGGSAWQRITEADGRPGQWYLHLFAPEQPDLNWENPEVRAEFDDILRFWFDRGVDGFRIDVANGLIKDPQFPDLNGLVFPLTPEAAALGEHPHWDRSAVHEIYRGWRSIAGEYADSERVFVAEAWVGNAARLARYVRPGELHSAFNFDFLTSPWLADELRDVIDLTIAAHAEVGAPPTWVRSNHDVPRDASRLACDQNGLPRPARVNDLLDRASDPALGQRRARAAALLTLALPGGAYIYQGEELGLPEVFDIPDESRQDPTWFNTAGRRHGRDGCRVPLPWTSEPATNFGFSGLSEPALPWLPQPPEWGSLSVAAEAGQPGSMLELYRAALRLRRELASLGEGELTWLDSPADVLAFQRGSGFVCCVNLGRHDYTLPEGWTILLASAAVSGELPSDTAVWVGIDRLASS
jgi:alpha-glucosidase